MTLTEFLLARIAEDEAEARHRDVVTFGAEQRAVAGIQGAFDPARVLAGCEAKRRIVELHRDWPVLVEGPMEFESVDPTDVSSMAFQASRQILWATEQEYRQRFGSEPPTGPILLAMAQVHADHPDFDESWRA